MSEEDPKAPGEFMFENPVDDIGFAILRHVIGLDPDLSDGAFRTFATYIRYAQQKTGCWPSIETVAADRGKSISTISRHNTELEKLGYIERIRRQGQTTLTILKDQTQMPRLQALATGELQKRNDRKNAITEIAKMRSLRSQKCNVEEEPIEEEPGGKDNHSAAGRGKDMDRDPVVGDGGGSGSITANEEHQDPVPGTVLPWTGPPPPAAIVYRSRTNRWPRVTLYQRLHEVIGDDPADLEFWGNVVSEYNALGWNVMNISGQLEWYTKRVLPHVTRPAAMSNTGTAGAATSITSQLNTFRQKMHNTAPVSEAIPATRLLPTTVGEVL